LQEIYNQFIQEIRTTTWLEYIAVITGILSVWFSRAENVLVYPVGLVSVIIYIFLSANGHLFGEASVNLYYTIMSVYGWILWSKKNSQKERALLISASSKKEWIEQLSFFAIFYVVIFIALSFLKKYFPGAIPWADAFASATAYTGMWLMAKKKIESWYWWIATNMASIPLYFVKHFSFTSVYYLVLLVLAVMGLISWKDKEKHATD
jgi:nicotinamide mononucleotide transporter